MNARPTQSRPSKRSTPACGAICRPASMRAVTGSRARTRVRSNLAVRAPADACKRRHTSPRPIFVHATPTPASRFSARDASRFSARGRGPKQSTAVCVRGIVAATAALSCSLRAPRPRQTALRPSLRAPPLIRRRLHGEERRERQRERLRVSRCEARRDERVRKGPVVFAIDEHAKALGSRPE